jgi:hypothetical protein
MGCWTYYFCPCFRDKWDSMFPPPEEKREVTDKEKRAAARKAKQEEALAEANRCDALFISCMMDRLRWHHLRTMRRQEAKDRVEGSSFEHACLPSRVLLSILKFIHILYLHGPSHSHRLPVSSRAYVFLLIITCRQKASLVSSVFTCLCLCACVPPPIACRQKNAPTLEYENFKARKAKIQTIWYVKGALSSPRGSTVEQGTCVACLNIASGLPPAHALPS